MSVIYDSGVLVCKALLSSRFVSVVDTYLQSLVLHSPLYRGTGNPAWYRMISNFANDLHVLIHGRCKMT